MTTTRSPRSARGKAAGDPPTKRATSAGNGHAFPPTRRVAAWRRPRASGGAPDQKSARVPSIRPASPRRLAAAAHVRDALSSGIAMRVRPERNPAESQRRTRAERHAHRPAARASQRKERPMSTVAPTAPVRERLPSRMPATSATAAGSAGASPSRRTGPIIGAASRSSRTSRLDAVREGEEVVEERLADRETAGDEGGEIPRERGRVARDVQQPASDACAAASRRAGAPVPRAADPRRRRRRFRPCATRNRERCGARCVHSRAPQAVRAEDASSTAAESASTVVTACPASRSAPAKSPTPPKASRARPAGNAARAATSRTRRSRRNRFD